MPFRGESRVIHLEGLVVDQGNQRGHYSVRAVLREVSSSGRREEVWDFYAAEYMAASRQLETEARRRINERGSRVVIYDRKWAADAPPRHVDRAFEGQQSSTRRRTVDWVAMSGGREGSLLGLPEPSWAPAAYRDTWRDRRVSNVEESLNPDGVRVNMTPSDFIADISRSFSYPVEPQ